MTTAAETSEASTAEVGHVLRLQGSQGDPTLSRAFVEPLVRDWKQEPLEFYAALVTTELVTNAVLHAQPAIVLAVRPFAKGVRIEVTDTRPAVLPHMAPRPAPSSSTSELTLGQSGRGLQVVSELAARWGVDSTQRTKTVWAELIDGQSGPTEPLLQLEYELLVRGGVTLQFLDLPTVTAVESGVQVEDVVRGIQLEHAGRLPEDPAVGRLFQLLLTTAADRLAGRHAAMFASAEDRPTFDLEMLTTIETMRDLGELSRMLEHPGDLLAIAPPNPPDRVVRFRRWLQEETARQLSGQLPRAFPAGSG